MNSLMWLTWERQNFSSYCILNPLQSDFYFHLSTEMTLISISKDSMLTQGVFFHLIWSSSSIWHMIYYGFLGIASPFGFSFTWVVLSSYFPLLVSPLYLRKCSCSPDLTVLIFFFFSIYVHTFGDLTYTLLALNSIHILMISGFISLHCTSSLNSRFIQQNAFWNLLIFF